MNSISRRTLAAVLAGGAAMTLTAVPASAIGGGTPVTGIEGPAASVVRISIEKADTNKQKQHECTGVVVSTYWILSSASCFADNPAQWQSLPAGLYKLDSIVDDAAYMGAARPAGKVQSSYTYIDELVPRRDRDLVLARASDPVGPAAKIATTPPVQGQSLKIVGTGRTSTEWIPKQAHAADVSVKAINPTSLTVSGNASTCRGDAGGPAFRDNNGSLELVAIHGPSWQHGCLGVTETRDESTEVRVDDIHDWIRQQIPDLNIECDGEIDMFTNRGGTLWRDKVGGDWAAKGWSPDTNLDSYGPNWLGGVYAGGNGLLWEVHKKVNASDPFANGDLRLWRRNGAALAGGERVGNGWTRQMEFPSTMTVDSEGRVYAINAVGELRSYVWNDTTRTWVNAGGDLLDTGWQNYTSITGAGNGVLYARNSAGEMFRFVYDHAARQWTQRNKSAGVGWNVFTNIFSPGGDILYALGSKHDTYPALRWYRYLPGADRWEPGDADGLGRVASWGSIWNTTYRATADPGGCRLTRP
nr:tachylectin-related carbohydrate-binding protein [Kibdelosporangium sp. MJ126-NF4]CEL16334.1 putative secreted esterase [Kibdelosporangium sp. MJ126-NF4]CTQ94258.1 putative secreted esterase [Kibdelosporangium sp. MJ126-NF4]